MCGYSNMLSQQEEAGDTVSHASSYYYTGRAATQVEYIAPDATVG